MVIKASCNATDMRPTRQSPSRGRQARLLLGSSAAQMLRHRRGGSAPVAVETTPIGRQDPLRNTGSDDRGGLRKDERREVLGPDKRKVIGGGRLPVRRHAHG
jgi:hypothetical protein